MKRCRKFFVTPPVIVKSVATETTLLRLASLGFSQSFATEWRLAELGYPCPFQFVLSSEDRPLINSKDRHANVAAVVARLGPNKGADALNPSMRNS